MDQDPYDLQRFVIAQAGTYERALGELTTGRKSSHWMWFVFPQLRGLGRSSTAEFYGIGSLDEARGYLSHPLLGPRLKVVTRAVLAIEGRAPKEIFGSPDDVKFHSSMSLFATASAATDDPFRQALERWFDGKRDASSLALLRLTASQ